MMLEFIAGAFLGAACGLVLSLTILSFYLGKKSKDLKGDIDNHQYTN